MKNLTDSIPVRVSLPASIAADIGSLKKVVGSVLDRLGCPACCSGHDILFELQRDLVISDKIRSSAIAGYSTRAKIAPAAFASLDIGLQPEAAAEIENVHAAIERIAELSGHPACATGCDMLFRMERILVLNEQHVVEEQLMRFG